MPKLRPLCLIAAVVVLSATAARAESDNGSVATELDITFMPDEPSNGAGQVLATSLDTLAAGKTAESDRPNPTEPDLAEAHDPK